MILIIRRIPYSDFLCASHDRNPALIALRFNFSVEFPDRGGGLADSR
jgi:hypothetical protein